MIKLLKRLRIDTKWQNGTKNKMIFFISRKSFFLLSNSNKAQCIQSVGSDKICCRVLSHCIGKCYLFSSIQFIHYFVCIGQTPVRTIIIVILFMFCNCYSLVTPIVDCVVFLHIYSIFSFYLFDIPIRGNTVFPFLTKTIFVSLLSNMMFINTLYIACITVKTLPVNSM